ncbi:hypothetical protein ACFL56_00460 [Candidatus Margulisiibacteriota bacterium]
MLCKHLQPLEEEIISKGIKELSRGQVWQKNCREWVYFDCYFDVPSIQKRMTLDECVVFHEHLGTHDGQEAGLECTQCHDAIMGHHLEYAKGKFSYR